MVKFEEQGKNSWSVAEAAAGCGVSVISGPAGLAVKGLTHDSRRVGPGFLFAAISGEKADGHSFIGQALERGAVGVLSEREPLPDFSGRFAWIRVPNVRQAMAGIAFALAGHPDRRIPFLGVTGTNGKTTITYLLEHLFAAQGHKPAVMGTVSRRYDGTEESAARTTPESTDIADFTSSVVADGGGPFIMEVSSHAVSLSRVYGVKFHTAVHTNLTQDHLDWYGSMEKYADAKRAWFDGRNGPVPERGIFNMDDEFSASLHGIFSGQRFGVAVGREADFSVPRHAYTNEGLRMTIRHAGKEWDIQTPLTGRGNLYNVLQSFAVAVAYGLDPDAAAGSLASLARIPGRLDEVAGGYPFRVFVDYAHSEDSLRNACAILREITPGRLITVFGCGGDKDKGKRPKMGKAAAESSHVVIVTSDNPRSEDPEAIIDAIVPGILEVRQDFIRQADRRRAIEQAVGMAREGDTILLAGKGHEREQILRHGTVPFHDGEIALQIMEATLGKGGPARRSNAGGGSGGVGEKMAVLDTLGAFASSVGGRLIPVSAAGTKARGIIIDSRTVKAGEIFCAVHGEHADGHAFVESAAAAGAVAALVEKPVSAPAGFPLIEVANTRQALLRFAHARFQHWGKPVIGVTGSSGKTTTKEFIAALLGSCRSVFRTPGNFNNTLGLPMAAFCLTDSHEIAVLEMGMSYPGEIAALCGVAPPDVAVVTNVGSVHLQNFSSAEQLAEAKAEIVRGMKAGGVFVCNADDPRVSAMRAQARGRVVSFGLSAGADVRVCQVRIHDLEKMVATLEWKGQKYDLHLRFAGTHMVMNLAAAVAAAIAAGMEMDRIVGAAASLAPVGMRGVVSDLGHGVRLLDDSYNSNPEAMTAVLRMLEMWESRPDTVLFAGEMRELGPDSERLHREIGARIARLPRLRLEAVAGHAAEMAAEAAKSGVPARFYTDASEVERHLAGRIRGGELVVVKASRGVGLDRIVKALKNGIGLEKAGESANER